MPSASTSAVPQSAHGAGNRRRDWAIRICVAILTILVGMAALGACGGGGAGGENGGAGTSKWGEMVWGQDLWGGA